MIEVTGCRHCMVIVLNPESRACPHCGNALEQPPQVVQIGSHIVGGHEPLTVVNSLSGLLHDWDAVRGVERIPAPLPVCCRCSRTALETVLNCPVHEVKCR